MQILVQCRKLVGKSRKPTGKDCFAVFTQHGELPKEDKSEVHDMMFSTMRTILLTPQGISISSSKLDHSGDAARSLVGWEQSNVHLP